MSDDFLPGRTFPRGRQLTVFAMLVSCFALWGLLNNMTDNLVPAFQRIFTMDPSRAGLVQVAFYGAYAVLALFASIIAEEFSYRVGVLAGLAVYVIGSLLYIPACVYASFDIYFVAIFTVAAGCSLLETTCNPYVLSLGDESTAVRRLNFAQAFNPVGSVLGIFLAQKLILANLNPATAAERAQMAPDVLAGIVRNELFWVCVYEGHDNRQGLHRFDARASHDPRKPKADPRSVLQRSSCTHPTTQWPRPRDARYVQIAPPVVLTFFTPCFSNLGTIIANEPKVVNCTIFNLGFHTTPFNTATTANSPSSFASITIGSNSRLSGESVMRS